MSQPATTNPASETTGSLEPRPISEAIGQSSQLPQPQPLQQLHPSYPHPVGAPQPIGGAPVPLGASPFAPQPLGQQPLAAAGQPLQSQPQPISVQAVMQPLNQPPLGAAGSIYTSQTPSVSATVYPSSRVVGNPYANPIVRLVQPEPLIVTHDKILRTPRGTHYTVARGKIDPNPPVRAVRVIFPGENGLPDREGYLYEVPGGGAFSTEPPGSARPGVIYQLGDLDRYRGLGQSPYGLSVGAPTDPMSYSYWSTYNHYMNPASQAAQSQTQGASEYAVHYQYIATLIAEYAPTPAELSSFPKDALLTFLSRDLYNYYIQPASAAPALPAVVHQYIQAPTSSVYTPRAKFILDYVYAMYRTVVQGMPFGPPTVPEPGIPPIPSAVLQSPLRWAPTPASAAPIPPAVYPQPIQPQYYQRPASEQAAQTQLLGIAQALRQLQQQLQTLSSPYLNRPFDFSHTQFGSQSTATSLSDTNLDLLTEQLRSLKAAADLQSARERALADQYNLALAPHPLPGYDWDYDARRRNRSELDVVGSLDQAKRQQKLNDDYFDRLYQDELRRTGGRGLDARRRLNILERASLHKLNQIRDRLLRELAQRQARLNEYPQLRERAREVADRLTAYQATLLNYGIHEKLQAAQVDSAPPSQGFSVRCPIPPPPPPPSTLSRSQGAATTPEDLKGNFPLWCPKCYSLSHDQIETFFALHPGFQVPPKGTDPHIVGTQPWDLIYRSYFDPDYIWPFDLRQALLDPRDKKLLMDHWRMAELELERRSLGSTLARSRSPPPTSNRKSQSPLRARSYTDDDLDHLRCRNSKGSGLYGLAFGGSAPQPHEPGVECQACARGFRCFSNIGGAGAQARLQQALSRQRHMAIENNIQLQAHRETVQKEEKTIRQSLQRYPCGPSQERLAKLTSNRPCTATCGAYNELVQIALGNRTGIPPPETAHQAPVREAASGIPGASYIVRAAPRDTAVPSAPALPAQAAKAAVLKASAASSNLRTEYVAPSYTPGYTTILLPGSNSSAASLAQTLPSRPQPAKAIAF